MMPAKTWAVLRTGLLVAGLLWGGESSLWARRILAIKTTVDPYAAACAAVDRLSEADRKALNEGRPLSGDATPIITEVAQSLSAGRRAESVSWRMDSPEQPGMSFPYVSSVREIAKVALSSTEKLTAGDVVERSLDVLTFARHVGRENFFVPMLVERSLEGQTAAWLQKNISRLSPADAERLLAGLEKLPPGADLSATLKREKEFFADALLHEVQAALGTAGEKAPVLPEASMGSLRMTGIVTEGGSSLIGFEHEVGACWLKPGERRNGITLLQVDLESDQALLTYKGQMVRLRLSSKQIAPIDLHRLAEAVKAAKPGSALSQLNADDVKEHGAEFVRMLERTSDQLGALFVEAATHPERFNDDAAFKLRLQALTPLAQMTAEVLPKIIARERKAEAESAALKASLLAISRTDMVAR